MEETEERLLQFRKESTRHTKCVHHLQFLEQCARDGKIPKGLQVNIKVNAVDQSDALSQNIKKICERAEKAIVEELITHYQQQVSLLTESMHSTKIKLGQAQDQTTVDKGVKDSEEEAIKLSKKLEERRDKKANNLRNPPDRPPNKNRRGFNQRQFSNARPPRQYRNNRYNRDQNIPQQRYEPRAFERQEPRPFPRQEPRQFPQARQEFGQSQQPMQDNRQQNPNPTPNSNPNYRVGNTSYPYPRNGPERPLGDLVSILTNIVNRFQPYECYPPHRYPYQNGYF